MHVTMESLLKDNDLITTIKDLVCGSGRSHPQGSVSREESATRSTENKQVANENLGMQLNGVERSNPVAVQ